ncbi:MAG: ribosomal protein [Chthonomonadaceae bacterium]|nr:ribosomal protein [Chthonomonadaceae bacterium]
MKVILTRDVPKVGKDGEIIAVADGYARNYLFPRQLAVVAKGAALKQHENRISREVAKTAALLSNAQANAEKLRDQSFQIMARSNPKSNRLFGAVTEADVVEIIQKNLGIEVDKRRVSLIDPIKVTGTYDLTARLHPEVIVPFKIEVVTPEILEGREKARVAAELAAEREAARLAAAEIAAQEQAAARAAAQEARGDEPPRERRPRRNYSLLDEAPDAEG